MKSIKEKRMLVNKLACNVAYNDSLCDTEVYDLAHGIIDCGYFEDKVLEGKCSLQATINFDMENWERQIDKDIKLLNSFQKLFPKCK